MERKRELHLLDVCVVELISALETLFWSSDPTKRLNAFGSLNFEVFEEVGSGVNKEVRVRIRPVSWPPTSLITARFWRNERMWHPFEGTVQAVHIGCEPFSVGGFPFRCQRAGHALVFTGAGTLEQKFIDNKKTRG